MNFCVLIHGSDELYAMPDKDTAERCAKAHSEMMKPWLAMEKAEGRMLWVTEQMVSGEAIEWPHSEAAFSEALKEFSLKDWGLV